MSPRPDADLLVDDEPDWPAEALFPAEATIPTVLLIDGSFRQLEPAS